MNGIKEIIIVSPNQYKDLARKLSHEISKVDGCNGAFWSIKQFEDNEFQLGGNRYAIFIGNSDENSLTHDFLPIITDLKKQAGASYGFDGSKAVIFGDGKLEQEKEFKKVLKESVAIAGGTALATTGAAVGTSLAISSVAFLPIAIPLIPSVLLGKYILRKKKEKALRTEQTKVALTLFLAKHFDSWLCLER